MNDRLKFRVRDRRTKELVEGVFLDEEGFVSGWSSCDRGAEFGLLNQEDYIIEQCTGLKDKNGALIYEGDVVIDIHKKRWIVGFHNETSCFIVENDEEIESFCEGADGFEIAGNIHENKELLK